MRVTRREFASLAAVAAGAAALGLRPPASLARLLRAETDVFTWQPVGGKCVVAMGQGGNAMIVNDGGETMLIDSKLAGMGEALRREAAARGGRLVRVINTHHHADHTGGNYAFTGDVPVFAHENCLPRVRAQFERYVNELRAAATRFGGDADPGAQQAVKDVQALLDRLEQVSADTFVPTQKLGEATMGKVGAMQFQLRHTGPGHTDNDIFVFIDAENVLHTGDLVFHKLHPFVDAAAGATTVGWQRAIDAMINLCDEKTVVVPGHGDVTDVKGLYEQVAYFDKMREAVGGAIKEGRTRDEVVAMDPPGFEGYGFEQLRGRALAAVYDELTKK